MHSIREIEGASDLRSAQRDGRDVSRKHHALRDVPAVDVDIESALNGTEHCAEISRRGESDDKRQP
jgi:hypothetical protein